jgi:general secretion pathway protein G
MMLPSSRARPGFSFVELLASLAILGLLASLAMPLAQTTVRRDKERDLRRALREIRQGIDAYKAATEDGRIAISSDASGYPADLNALVVGIPNARSPVPVKLYFLRRLPRDPFFPDASVPAADTWGQRSFASAPDAPTQGDDVFDVNSLSGQSGLNGIPYREW